MKATQQQQTLDMNPEFVKALDSMEHTDKSIFITGRAGTGKSTLLNYFRYTSKKLVAVLAPTGVAAINVQGQTIHSFFKFKPDITLDKVKVIIKKDAKKNIYKKISALIIDEISMVRADLLDCVDKFLRLNRDTPDEPFGGVQMIFIGDLYQLPPIVTSREREVYAYHYKTPYFFSAKVLASFSMEFIELEKIYRQKDDQFIALLNNIRNNSITEEEIDILNACCDPTFVPPKEDFFVTLTTTNAMAVEINLKALAKLPSQEYVFSAIVDGKFGKEYWPAPVHLQVKVGSQIMLLNNDSAKRWVNGTMGKIVGFEPDEFGQSILVQLPDEKVVRVLPNTWEVFNFFVEGNMLQSSVVGTFQQYPLMLAWAVTIHKSQGKTFDRVIIDVGRGTFAHGQMYVALSRCTTLEGMVLRRPLEKKHIWMDREVVKFQTTYQYQKSDEALSLPEKVALIKDAIKHKATLHITYLKPNDIKSRRTIQPTFVGDLEYNGKLYLGVEAFCLERKAKRVFRVDRILEVKEGE